MGPADEWVGNRDNAQPASSKGAAVAGPKQPSTATHQPTTWPAAERRSNPRLRSWGAALAPLSSPRRLANDDDDDNDDDDGKRRRSSQPGAASTAATAAAAPASNRPQIQCRRTAGGGGRWAVAPAQPGWVNWVNRRASEPQLREFDLQICNVSARIPVCIGA